MTPPELPDVCGECVCFLDPPRANGAHGETYTCRPYKLPHRPGQKACRSRHAAKRAVDDGQGALL